MDNQQVNVKIIKGIASNNSSTSTQSLERTRWLDKLNNFNANIVPVIGKHDLQEHLRTLRQKEIKKNSSETHHLKGATCTLKEHIRQFRKDNTGQIFAQARLVSLGKSPTIVTYTKKLSNRRLSVASSTYGINGTLSGPSTPNWDRSYVRINSFQPDTERYKPFKSTWTPEERRCFFMTQQPPHQQKNSAIRLAQELADNQDRQRQRRSTQQSLLPSVTYIKR